MSVFSEIDPDNYVFESEFFFAIYDRFPVSEGHILIISKQEKKDYFELNQNEQEELPKLILKAKGILEDKHSPDGYNIGMNCGEVAGQTVMHFHCHVIPRYKGDMGDPRGGVRHCVEGKGYY
ncbi:HIT family protein [Robiginitalea sediminis]|uniref:HIT family protein n=1 Tax=Robiginitalea sediminis TaxID=1982593 RepID=UPI000B4BA218|nr:HIT family protein [Robiginitalea sediminis]